MSFTFTHRRGIEKQVRQIAREQIGKALEACADTHAEFDAVVHGLRRRCKKLRGLVRLVEPHLDGSKTEDRAFRDAARSLSGSRDAAVMAETFEAVRAFDRKSGERIEPSEGKAILRWLQSRVGQTPTGTARKQMLGEFVGIFERADKRARDWSLSGKGFAKIGDGLEATYRLMRQGLRDAEQEGTAELLHEWRKHTKYHWHHVSLLEPSAPDMLAPRRKLLDRLGEALGDHHNLHVLAETLGDYDDAKPDALAAVHRAIAALQDELARDAFVLGRQLTAETSSSLGDRFGRYWALLPRES
ncbi:MAG TPA: CHAD domain-containing protein [Devosia sp.]|jgi:CHAD domain-containing protein|uniref:CHAD domain-containing protein n=1 Tax=Devosia sp. TaxID=1871048 RepID=UPI002F933B85